MFVHRCVLPRILSRLIAATLCVGALSDFAPQLAAAEFPDRPITIVVYTGSGGLIDTTARQFAEIAKQHCTATFVIKNIPEGKGIAAMKYVLEGPADGYTLYAGTKSNVPKAITAGKTHYLTSLDWIALMMTDPECVITRRDSGVAQWEALVEHARQHPGDQVWVGPDTGGLDHVMALRTWDAFGIRARWVPFKSGGEALTNLMGGQGIAYVGNPLDALESDNLRVALVSHPERLTQFPDAPTYGELGFPQLDHEVMWRGFAVKEGTPQDALAWYDQLFRAVDADPQWRELWAHGGIDVEYRKRDVFAPRIREDIQVFTHYLQQLDLFQTTRNNRFSAWFEHYGLASALGLLLATNLAGWFWVRGNSDRLALGPLLIPLNVLATGVILLAASFTLVRTEGIGPALVPRLWIGLLMPSTLVLVSRWRIDSAQRSQTVHGMSSKSDADIGRSALVRFVLWLLIYLVTLWLCGYYVATFVFLVGAMRMLGLRHVALSVGLASLWLLVSYLLFARFLHVDLPTSWAWATYLR